ncbi:hypothetical protein [Salinisphaera orenii]
MSKLIINSLRSTVHQKQHLHRATTAGAKLLVANWLQRRTATVIA